MEEENYNPCLFIMSSKPLKDSNVNLRDLKKNGRIKLKILMRKWWMLFI